MDVGLSLSHPLSLAPKAGVITSDAKFAEYKIWRQHLTPHSVFRSESVSESVHLHDRVGGAQKWRKSVTKYRFVQVIIHS